MKTTPQRRARHGGRNARAGESEGPCRQAAECCCEFKIMRLRETSPPSQLVNGDTPFRTAAYWRFAVESAPGYQSEVETLASIHLNVRNRIIGHHIVSNGTADTVLCDASAVFRAAILSGARGLILAHNHPSGDLDPTDGDVKATVKMIRAGRLVGIEVLDHLIIGHPQNGSGFASLRALGYFAEANC